MSETLWFIGECGCGESIESTTPVVYEDDELTCPDCGCVFNPRIDDSDEHPTAWIDAEEPSKRCDRFEKHWAIS